MAGAGDLPLGCGICQSCSRQALVPFVIDAQARQPGYRVPLKQLLQADHTLTSIFSQHVICKTDKKGRPTGSVTSRWVAESKQVQQLLA